VLRGGAGQPRARSVPGSWSNVAGRNVSDTSGEANLVLIWFYSAGQVHSETALLYDKANERFPAIYFRLVGCGAEPEDIR
jgi:hypothetical protein